MPLKASDYHNHLKLKTKAQICYFLLFLSVFLRKIVSGHEGKQHLRHGENNAWDNKYNK